MEEVVGNQPLPETCLITATHQSLQVSYVTQLHITAVLQVLPTAGCRTSHGHSGCYLTAKLIAVLDLQVHRVRTVIILDIPDIGSQTHIMSAIGTHLAPVERFGLRLTGLDKRQQIAYLIVLQPAHQLQLVQAMVGQITGLEQDIARLLLTQKRQAG